MYKAVKSAGYICEINRQTENDIANLGCKNFLITMARKSQKPICHTLLPALAPTWKSYQEKIEKLISYALNKNVISKEDIDAVCIKQLNVRNFLI